MTTAGTWLRIIAVWATALCLMGLLMGGPQGFTLIVALFGAILTLPALLLLALVSEVERRLLGAGKRIAGTLTGVAAGLLLPAILYAVAPNPENAAAGMELLLPLCGGTGLLWSLSTIALLRREAPRAEVRQPS